ncbi:MAG: DegT/DnrJ/EryC1/StrS family aminotransferase [Phycisphaeraceae bacterium]|nr:DegT/DnrJ/EryC1/StrS family aminotransferase [Phycisphaeraceae bacterium]
MRRILNAKPSITQREVDYVTDAAAHGWGLDCYGYLNRFIGEAKQYFDSELAWPTSSCHGALHMVLMALGVGPGDEVIVPDATWTGSVFPISWLGATPVFVDVKPDTWCVDPRQVGKAITAKTKAVIAVHLYGNLCEMDELVAVCNERGVTLIEDAAEAIGSEYKGRKAGSIADFGVFSFHGTKTLTTGEGGLILSHRTDLASKVTAIDSQGRHQGAKTFWVDEIGLKYKMSNLQAALGLAQLERAEELVQRKRETFHQYQAAFADWSDITLNPEPAGTLNSYWMPTVVFGPSYQPTVDQRNTWIDACVAAGVEARPFFYPVSDMPMYTDMPQNTVSRELSASGINLPSSYELTPDDVGYVVSTLRQAVRG